MPKGIYKRKPQTLEHIRNRVNGRKGYKHSQETIEKIRNSNIGWKHSEETKKKFKLRIPVMLGKKHSAETKSKMSLSSKGKAKSELHRLSMSKSRIGKPHILTEQGLKSFKEKTSGENNFKWIKDRSRLKKSEKKHLDGQYRDWMLFVKRRDKWACRIADVNCDGRLEAHHILNWIEYPELRYEINNGITLCHAHHPRGRAKEKLMSPYFMELVTSKE